MEKKAGGLEEELFVQGRTPYSHQEYAFSSIPTYFLSLFPLPAGIAKRLERFQRDFMWDNPGGEHNLHLVN